MVLHKKYMNTTLSAHFTSPPLLFLTFAYISDIFCWAVQILKRIHLNHRRIKKRWMTRAGVERRMLRWCSKLMTLKEKVCVNHWMWISSLFCCSFFGVKAMEWARPFWFGYYFINYSARCFFYVPNYLFIKLLRTRWIVSVKAGDRASQHADRKGAL